MNFDYQANVIGSLLIQPSLLAECDLAVSEFDENYGIIYQAILDVEASSDPIDVISVSEQAKKNTGRDFYKRIGELSRDYAIARSSQSIKMYASKVRQECRKESGKEIAQSLIKNIDSDDSIDIAIRDLMKLNERRKNYDSSLSQAMVESMHEMDEVVQNGGMVGITTGLARLDEVLGGLHNSDLIVVGARPSMGKTAFMINLALSAKVPLGIISTEQPNTQIGSRVLSIDGRVPLHKMRTAKLEQDDWSKMSRSLTKLKDRVIRINDNSAADINDIFRQARKWKQLHDIKILYVDYVQNISGDNKLPRHQQVSEIVRGLKTIARELDIPVLALAQVNRKCEDRTDKRPFMSELCDSSEIEKAADQIMFLYRDEVYNENTPDKNVMEIDVKKNRHGPIGMTKVIWLAEYISIENYAPQYAA